MNKSRKIIAFLTALVLFSGMASILLPDEVFPISSAMAATSPEKAPTTEPNNKDKQIVYGKKITVGNSYYILKKNGTAIYMGPVNKNRVSITIPSTVTVKGVRFKITQIGDKAFKGCKKLKTINIKSKYLTKVSNKAFYGLRKSQVKKIKVYYTKRMSTSNLKKLKKALKKAGVSTRKIYKSKKF